MASGLGYKLPLNTPARPGDSPKPPGEPHWDEEVLFVNELGISAHKFTDLTGDRTHDLASKIGIPNLSASWLALSGERRILVVVAERKQEKKKK